MSGFDFKAFAERRKKLKEKGFGGKGKKHTKRERWKFKGFGTWGFYVGPAAEGMDGMPFIPVEQHFSVAGDNRQIHMCFGSNNVGLWSPAVQAALDARNERLRKSGKPEWAVEIEEGVECPTCNELAAESSGFSDQVLEEMGLRSGGVFNIVPLFFEAKGSGERVTFPTSEQIFRPWTASERMTDDILNLIASQRVDFTDPEAATILVVSKSGPSPTRYNFSLDTETLRTPFRVPKPIAAQLKKTVAGGGLCLFEQVANGVRSPAAVMEWLGQGSEPSTDEGAADDGKPSCWGDKDECDPKDDYCQKCPHKETCAAEVGCEVPMAEVVAPKVDSRPPKRKAGKPKKAPAIEAKAEDAEVVDDEPEPGPEPENLGTIDTGSDDFMADFEAALAAADE